MGFNSGFKRVNDEAVHAKKARHISEVTASFVLNLGTRSR